MLSHPRATVVPLVGMLLGIQPDAEAVVAAILTEHPDLAGIIYANDEESLGGWKALKADRRRQRGCRPGGRTRAFSHGETEEL